MHVQVSIIMPAHNSAEFIALSINSVLAQTFTDFELIVVDDCSKDSTFSFVQELSSRDSRIRVFQLSSNSGAAVARNTAIDKARGRFIAFLDSDDIWFPTKLEEQLDFMMINSVAFCYSAYDKVNASRDIVGSVAVPDKVSYSDLLKTNSIGCLTAIYDTSKLGKVFMPLIKRRQDLGLWLKLLKMTPYAYGINKPLASYYVRQDSLSSNKLVAASYTWRLYRDVEKLSFLSALYYFSHYAIKSFLRTKFPLIAYKLGLFRSSNE